MVTRLGRVRIMYLNNAKRGSFSYGPLLISEEGLDVSYILR